MRLPVEVRSVHLALLLLLVWPSLAHSEKQDQPHQKPSIGQLIAAVKASTSPVEISAFGDALAAREPQSEGEAKLLLEAMSDAKIAPHAQMSIAKATAPALGAVLHEGLKSLRKDLRKVDSNELNHLPYPEWRLIEQHAMSVAAVIHALGVMKYQPAAADLRELLSYDDKLNGYISWEASTALAAMGDETGINMVLDKTGQGKPINISGLETRAIRKILNKVEEVDARTDLDARDPRRYSQVAELGDELGGIRCKDRTAKLELRQLLSHKHSRVQWGASDALRKTLAPEDRGIASEMLHNGQAYVRARGLESLYMSKVWEKSFLPMVLDMLQHDPDESVRMKAAETLKNLTDDVVPRKEMQEAIPFLKAALQDRFASVRFQAFYALRIITGRFYPYEGMWDDQKIQMREEPVDLYSR